MFSLTSVANEIETSGQASAKDAATFLGIYGFFVTGFLIVLPLLYLDHGLHPSLFVMVFATSIIALRLLHILVFKAEVDPKSNGAARIGDVVVSIWLIWIAHLVNPATLLLSICYMTFTKTLVLLYVRNTRIVRTFIQLTSAITFPSISYGCGELTTIGYCFLYLLFQLFFERHLKVQTETLEGVVQLGAQLEATQKDLMNARMRASTEARLDLLSKIGNRRAFYEYCENIKDDQQYAYYVLGLLDLKKFKKINDENGYEVGDELIAITAARLDEAMSESGAVFRLGGDEFALLFRDKSIYQTALLENLVADALEEPAAINHLQIHIKWSMGMVRIPHGETSAAEFLPKADYALQKTKPKKHAASRLFTNADEIEVEAQRTLQTDVTESLASGRFVSFFQPLITLENGRPQCYGYESLVRAKTKTGTPIPPNEFVHLCEEMGLASQLTTKTLIKSIRGFSGAEPQSKLAFNLSRQQILDPNLAENIESVLDELCFSPKKLILEISETTMENEIEIAKKNLDRLRRSGVKIALDDFGSGSTGVKVLKKYRYDLIKGDISVLQNAKSDKLGHLIFYALAEICEKMRIPCVMEGIETKEDLDLAVDAGYTMFQGYYFGKPLPQLLPAYGNGGTELSSDVIKLVERRG